METREELEERATYWAEEWNAMRYRNNTLSEEVEELESARRKLADIGIITIAGTVAVVGFINIAIDIIEAIV